MIETADITKRINSDFEQNADEAIKILEDALLKYDYLKNDRIIRCIIYLAEKNLEALKRKH